MPTTNDQPTRCGVYPASDCSAFPSEFLGSFPQPTPEEIAARELAEDYHRVTEEFDRSVCTGPIINGAIRPACVNELYTINRFARTAYANRLEKAIAEGVTPKQFQRAVAVAVHRRQNPGIDARPAEPTTKEAR